ncbi:hypothetical protein [Cohnella sp. AR92]|uniref:hypothetical protein n=1 Tax=Cohnella sp. AR92 TaxID=648716 RepID=UPI000F8E5EF4|nr:hypothetical protein [Cohnella sp. AR92]RUS44649.1 hypothetical protein ELR57_22980 [Cohnella sp. AR92]
MGRASRPAKAKRSRSGSARKRTSVPRSGRSAARRGRRGPDRRIPWTPVLQQLQREGEAVGRSWRSSFPGGSTEELKAYVQQKWNEQRPSRLNGQRTKEWQANWSGAKAFGDGAMKGAGSIHTYIPIGIGGTAAAVVYVGPDSRSPSVLLQALDALPFQEIILVCGDAQEQRMNELRRHPRATIAHFPTGMDPSIGRALGAKLTGADIVVFADADQAVPAETLARYLWECDTRLDVALNDRSTPGNLFQHRGTIDRFHEFLNVSLGRADLKMNTMAALPFALSRAALDILGPNTLSVPVKAHAAAVLKGLRIGTVANVDWKYPSQASAALRILTRQAAGDHLEAWRTAMEARGKRLYFGDSVRNRKAVGGVVYDADVHHHP